MELCELEASLIYRVSSRTARLHREERERDGKQLRKIIVKLWCPHPCAHGCTHTQTHMRARAHTHTHTHTRWMASGALLSSHTHAHTHAHTPFSIPIKMELKKKNLITGGGGSCVPWCPGGGHRKMCRSQFFPSISGLWGLNLGG